MKKTTRTLCLHSLTALILAALSMSAATARDWGAIKASGTIQAVTEGAFAPFNMVEKDKPTGFEVEIAEAVAKEMGVKLEWKIIPFDAEIPAIQQDRYDFAIASHGYSEERAKAVSFAAPHYCTGGIIAANQGGPLTIAALKGKKIAVQLATSYYEAAKKIDGVKDIKTYKADPEAFGALKAKRVDAWISDRFLVKETLGKNKGSGIVTGDLVFAEKVSMITQKGNTSLIEAWDKGLKAIMDNGSYAKISDKYFAENIACK